ncbi:MAG TPA: hypothetical protein VNE61_14795 [Ktedonobacteraceae bacterium]|nr:hypothetical protein [Ktedonobacteraceae bacterium]
MPQQQQQQQFADYDLLAVFGDESKAEGAATKLHKEGFSDEEVLRLPSDYASGAQFRLHGPSSERGAYFLQTARSGPNPARIITYAIVFGIILGVILFVAHFAVTSIAEPLGAIIGAAVGVIVGAVVGFVQRGPTRGAIGQDMSRIEAAQQEATRGALTVVAVRLTDADNAVRKSRARGILLTNGGKINRNVGRDTP